MAGYTNVTATRCIAQQIIRAGPLHFQTGLIFIIIVNILIAMAGIVANGLIIAAYCRNRRLRNMRNFIYLALAVTDFSVTAFLQPLFIAGNIATKPTIQGLQYCLIWELVSINSFICINLSLLTSLILSLQSFMTLAYPYRYQTFFTKYRLKIIVFFSWFLVISITIMLYFLNKLRFAVLSSLVLGLLTIVTVIYTWVWTYKLVNRHRRAIETTQTPSTSKIVAEKKILRSTVTVAAVISSMLACYILNLGYLFYYVVRDDWGFDKNYRYYILWSVAMTMTFLNSLVNPCLVFWRNSSFRETVRGFCRRN
jgi:hypothetical protein